MKAIFLTVLLMLITAVMPTSPHFVGTPALIVSDTGIQVCFKEAGLGDNQNITYALTADATATYVCVNNGGQCPNADNKITVNGPLTATATISSDKNGNVVGCVHLGPVDAGGFTCPNGQTRTLASASWQNVKITDTTNGVSAAASPSGAALTFFTCP